MTEGEVTVVAAPSVCLVASLLVREAILKDVSGKSIK